MDVAGISYRRVKADLRKVAEDYFSYLTKDMPIPDRDHQKRLVADAQIFLGWAKVYHDPSTVQYLNEMLEKETNLLPSAITSPANNSYIQSHNNVVKKHTLIETRRKRKKLIVKKPKEISDFKPLEDILSEFSIDKELFAYVAKNTAINVETRNINESSILGITNEAYQEVKRYIQKLRS